MFVRVWIGSTCCSRKVIDFLSAVLLLDGTRVYHVTSAVGGAETNTPPSPATLTQKVVAQARAVTRSGTTVEGFLLTCRRHNELLKEQTKKLPTGLSRVLFPVPCSAHPSV